MAYKGKYRPRNIRKYLGDPRKITFRSTWERKFMVYCDTSPQIIEWASEEIVIPYLHPDGKTRRYYPDFYIKRKNKNGIKEYVIEIKPKKQTRPPKRRNLKEELTWEMNKSKWEAARIYCEERNWEFQILNEDHLGV